MFDFGQKYPFQVSNPNLFGAGSKTFGFKMVFDQGIGSEIKEVF